MNEINKENSNFSIGSRLLVHFRNLKKIFQNEQQEVKKIREISLQNLEEWLIEKSKPLMEEIQIQINEILMKVDEEAQKARFNVEVLENAKLQNPNIPFKAKQYMEGNRKAYIRAINSFSGHLEINNRDYFYLLDFCKQFDDLLNDLNKGTLRSYTILQEFFANEAGKIAQNLKNFDDLFKELKIKLNNEEIVAINDTRTKIQSLKTRFKQKINLDIDFKNLEAEVRLANNAKDAVMADIEKFNISAEHNNFLRLNKDKKNKANEFFQDENQILQSFSILEKPLRKYSHIAFEFEEIILSYLKEPIETLVSDKDLKILEILENLERVLQENNLQLDEKRKEKSIEEIKKLNKEFIEQFVKKYYSFKKEMEELDTKIKATGVAEKLKNFNNQLEVINIRIEKYTQEFNQVKNDIIKATSSITNLKSEIENSLKDIFNEEIKISI